MNEMKQLRDWCAAEPIPAPAQLTGARDRLDAAMAREADPGRPVTPGHRAALFRRRWPRWVAPLATAVAVSAVITATFTVSHLVFGAREQPAGPPPWYTSLPRYYAGSARVDGFGIRATATGRLLAAVPAHQLATATANGLTYVFGSVPPLRSIPRVISTVVDRERITFEVVHVTAGGATDVSRLSLPEPLTFRQNPSIAISPGGRRLAVAYVPYPAQDRAVVQVITLATGRVRQWAVPDAQGGPVLGAVDAWSADGRTLAVELWNEPQMVLLNTTADGGRPSRQVVLHVPAGYRLESSPPMLTPNGAELIAPIETGSLPNPWRGGIAAFSARTGALIDIRGRWKASAHEVRTWNTLQILAWSNWSGSKLIEVQPRGSAQVLGELSGGVFTRTGSLLPRQPAGYRTLRRALIADSGVIW